MEATEARRRIAELEERVADLTRALKAGRSAAETALRGIADALPVMISYVDADQRFRFANKAYEDWFGMPVDRIVERPLAEVMSAEVHAARLPYVERALRGERVRFEASFPHPGGLRRTVVDHIPHEHKGQVLGFYALVQDVTEQWRALNVATESEARFRRAADSAPIPMWVTGPDRTREFANQAYLDFLGLPYADALRFDWRNILHEEDHDRVVRESLAGEAGGRRFTLEARYRRADGEWRWLRSVSQPRFDAAGMPEGFIGVADDITEVKRAAEAARAHAADLADRVDRRTRERDRLWDLSRDMIAICDLDGTLRSVSPSWTAVLGWSPDRLIGRNSEWMVHPDDVAAVRERRARAGAGKPTHNFTDRMRAADGGYRWISWSAVPDGDSIYCVGRDVTAEREQAHALTTAEEALRQSQKMESLGQLTGGVAHDFNNLLTPILGTLDIVSRRLPEGDRTARMVDAALQSADRARTLVQRLLAFARRQPLQLRPLALGPLVEGMRRLLESTLGPRIEIVMAVAADLPAALGDANQLELALLNLAVNARDAMPDGGRLAIAVEERALEGAPGDDLAPGRYVVLRVSDTGSGMDTETLRRATEPFFSTKAQGAGTGLGLSMAHGLAGQLGGGLLIDSAPGRGTSVELLLPVTDVAPAASAKVDGEVGGPPLRVLLVDDDPLVRLTTARLVSDMGHVVVECGSGAEAIAQLDQGFEPDLLVCDQVMPQMSGTQLIAIARERLPDMGLLMISGYPQGDDRRCPGLERLAKPFTADELARAIHTAQRVRPARAA